MKKIIKLLKAIANQRRLEILRYIHNHKKKEATVGEIAEVIKLSFKSTSRHLAVLRDADILDRDQRGLEAYYKLSQNKHSILKNILSIV